ncbi:MAG: bifunctional precorrin-2 dehydrogenase/sirohydrochlorin ferrochelatase [Euryarchaeota archaeon]|nr:bifunctional precorrin-2 dehydrogenase/sirohydrochlorin ferrochelatase [Euryarchaeota archaeon]
MLPLMIDFTGRRVVVFGGGEVGLRKARYFAREAKVVAVSLDFVDGFRSEPIRTVRSDLNDSLDTWLEWADYVVAATDDPRLNERICSAAMARGRQYNRADGVGSFLLPSVVDRGNLTIAVSTHGRSPAVSKRLKEHLDLAVGEEWSSMVRLQEELREEVRASLPDRLSRESFLRSVVEDPEILETLTQDYEKAKRLAMRKLGSD